MTDLDAFKALLERIWGQAAATLPPGAVDTNNVIGGLNSSANRVFAKNFITRLERLADAYRHHNRGSLLDVVRCVATRQWAGAFAELAAYDYFNRRASCWSSRLQVDVSVNIDGTRTFARQFGKAGDANLDGEFKPYNVFFDVKAFKDNVKDILDGVYREVHRHYGLRQPRIQAEYPLALHYEPLQQNRSALVAELIAAFDPRSRNTFLKSATVPGFNFRAQWGRGVLMTTHEQNPYSFAQHYYFDVFNHADKFVRDRPSFIAYVVFPWYNLLTVGLEDHNQKIYRSFARRVFCQFRNSTELLSTRISGYTGGETIWEISQALSGILFLEDTTILGDSDSSTQTRAYWYLNPNAANPLDRGVFEAALSGLPHQVFDTFQHDNY